MQTNAQPTQEEAPGREAEGTIRQESMPGGGEEINERTLHRWQSVYQALQPLATWERLEREKQE